VLFRSAAPFPPDDRSMGYERGTSVSKEWEEATTEIYTLSLHDALPICALDGGCDSIEHGLEITDAQIAQMVKQCTWYCATLAPYYHDWAPADTPNGQRDRKRVSEHGVSFNKALKAGVKIVFGTDMGGIPWTEAMAQEFPRMAEFGMAPMDIIKSATSRAADMLDMTGQIGVVAPGAYADIVAVNGDPLRDINVLGDVTFVMKDGGVFRNDVK